MAAGFSQRLAPRVHAVAGQQIAGNGAARADSLAHALRERVRVLRVIEDRQLRHAFVGDEAVQRLLHFEALDPHRAALCVLAREHGRGDRVDVQHGADRRIAAIPLDVERRFG